MSEVIDPVEEMEPGDCKGTYDESSDQCNNECYIKTECIRLTRQNPKAVAAPPPPLDSDGEDLTEMTSHECLTSCLKGRYDVMEKKDGSLTILNCSKDGSPIAQIRFTESGRYLMRTKKATLQLDELESARQASEIFKAILAG